MNKNQIFFYRENEISTPSDPGGGSSGNSSPTNSSVGGPLMTSVVNGSTTTRNGPPAICSSSSSSNHALLPGTNNNLSSSYTSYSLDNDFNIITNLDFGTNSTWDLDPPNWSQEGARPDSRQSITPVSTPRPPSNPSYRCVFHT